ncbi:hypothetical protein [Anaeroselena agilis]|uniref:Uncharacterized protein n=1 Tax=Anaeroselena agilis TaxID=3063788 RepID=A0ABU3NWG7_9FIRM|nr:hypothetical protein [Selenomonadales bacterium 4137-cl]
MKQIKIDIGAALAAKTATLGKVYPGWPPANATYPCAAFYRVAGQRRKIGGVFADTDELYSVDCFAKTQTETENMELAVDEAMETMPYAVTCEHGPDLYEEEAKVFHKILRYRIKSKGGI